MKSARQGQAVRRLSSDPEVANVRSTEREATAHIRCGSKMATRGITSLEEITPSEVPVVARQSVMPFKNQIQEILAQSFPRGGIDRVLLINPPDSEAELFRLATAKRQRYFNYPPYGLAVLAANLRRVGVDAQILNLNHEILKTAFKAGEGETFDFDGTWQTRVRDAVEAFHPDFIGVTCMFTMTHLSMRRLCEHLAQFDIPIAIGGVHVTNDVERVLDDIPVTRFAFTQEADCSIRQFVQAVRGELGLEQLGQIIVNDSKRARRYRLVGDVRPSGDDLNLIPAHDLIDVGNQTQYGIVGNFHAFKPRGARSATCLSNRGCRAQCTFCSVRNFNGKAVRQRTVENVLDELQLLQESYGIEHIVWLDDDLLKDHARAIALFNGMVRRDLKLTWDATNGVIAASCTEDVVHAMAASGCIGVNVGMESGNPEILRRIKKPGTVRNFMAAADVLRRYEQIHARVYLMLGFPGETLSQINDTINVARAMDLDWYSIATLQPLPNTPIYDSMVAQGSIMEAANKDIVSYNSGGYGKQDLVDLGIRAASQNFEEAFGRIAMDDIPTRAQLDDIWFFMNYHLNFHRLFSEQRPVKLHQQLLHLATVSDVIAPEHGFALYFTGYLQHALHGAIDRTVVARLERKLGESPYWNDRFKAFGLAVEDLRTATFDNRKIPRLLPGQVPMTDVLLRQR
jgi:radical SAM superfamily enzyme YgiQ (UPF0313 family)